MKTGRELAGGVAAALISGACRAESFDAQVETLVRPLANGLSNIVFYKVDLLGQDFPLIVLWLALAAVLLIAFANVIDIVLRNLFGTS
ncbi:MAG: hypothetical protein KDI21_17715, partial [Halieaceae bacterium]|nr:hypothetical protein [Halieaceae bacterium]